MQSIRKLLQRIARLGMLRQYRDCNRVSFWLCQWIEQLPLKRLVGINLAGLSFAAAVIVPQVSNIATQLKVEEATVYTVVDVVPTESKLRWPLRNFGLSQRFSISHPGLDLTAPYGTNIYPVSEGWVAWTNAIPVGFGKHLLVEHDNGLQSLYAHLSQISVTPGQTVTRATSIGKIGASGWATGQHLHLEIYQNGTPVNPLEVLPEIGASH